MTERTASYTVVESDTVLPRGVLAEVRDNEVVVERIATPKRYYVFAVALALVGASYSAFSVWAGVAGALLGGAAGVAVAYYLSNRRKSHLLERVRDGDRELSSDVVLKKNKVDYVERADGDDPSVSVVTPETEKEFRGTREDVEAIYEALV